MPNTLRIRSIKTDELLSYRKALESLNPATQVGSLNSALVFSAKNNTLTLYVADSTALATLDIEADIESNGLTEDFGFFVDYRKIFEIISSYKKEIRDTIIIEMDVGPSSFKLYTSIDKLSLPHLEMSPEQVFDCQNNPFLVNAEEFSFSLATFPNKKDFLTGLINCSKFLGTTDKKFNAIALYGDKLIVNDRRHIFIYNFEEPVELGNTPISIHKLSAKILGSLPDDTFEYVISKDTKRALVKQGKMLVVLNNAMSNIMPPSEDDLNSLRPEVHTFDLKSEAFTEVTTFFRQFYSSSSDLDPLIIETGDDLKFILRDSGLVGYNSCNVERQVETPILSDVPCTSIIICSSLDTFLGLLPKDTDVSVFDDDDHKAVFCKTIKRSLYLAKFGAKK